MNFARQDSQTTEWRVGIDPINGNRFCVGTGEGTSNKFIIDSSTGMTIYNGLGVSGNVTLTDSIIHDGDTDTKIRFPAADTFSVETAGSERLRIDSSGRLLIGLTAAVSLPYTGYGAIQTQGSYNTSSINIVNNESNGNTSALTFNKIRGTGSAGGTDAMGGINWGAYDGSAWRSGITVEGKLTSIGSNAVPSKLIFKVNSGSSITERFAITPNGVTFNGDTAAANALDDYEEGTAFTSTGNASVYQAAYTKVGRLVTISFRASVTSGNTQTLSLPFVHAGNNGDHILGVVKTGSTFKEIILASSSSFTLTAGFSKGTLTYPTNS